MPRVQADSWRNLVTSVSIPKLLIGGFSPTHLRNIIKLEIFPKIRVNIKNIWNHQPAVHPIIHPLQAFPTTKIMNNHITFFGWTTQTPIGLTWLAIYLLKGCNFPSLCEFGPLSSGTWNRPSGLHRWKTDQSLAYFTSAGKGSWWKLHLPTSLNTRKKRYYP